MGEQAKGQLATSCAHPVISKSSGPFHVIVHLLH